MDKAKNDFKDKVREELGIKINQVKVAGHGASVENGNTTMKFLHPDNREKVINLFYCKDDEQIRNLSTLLDQASVIIGVTNRIGKIKVQEFKNYVHSAYMHWLDNFKKFVHIKNSLHWTLAHVAELIARNNGYTLAEYSENSFENWIKHYHDTTEHHARNTSMSDNDIDSLRAMWLHTRQDIRKLDKQLEKKQEDNELTQKIHSFFIINEDGKKWTFQG